MSVCQFLCSNLGVVITLKYISLFMKDAGVWRGIEMFSCHFIAGSMDPYCVVYVDNPPQSEVTSVVKSSLNPFWDEQFYL